MQQMVARFASRGQHSAAGLPPWPELRTGATVMRLVPGQSGLYDAEAHHDCGFWRGLYPRELG